MWVTVAVTQRGWLWRPARPQHFEMLQNLCACFALTLTFAQSFRAMTARMCGSVMETVEVACRSGSRGRAKTIANTAQAPAQLRRPGFRGQRSLVNQLF